MAKILAVEDLTKNIVDLETSLAGHDILVVKTVIDAFNALHDQVFDMVISAVHFESGLVFDLLKFVKNSEQHRQTLFILFCNDPGRIAQYVSDTTETTARLLGADAFITTFEFDAEQFKHQVECILDRTHNTLAAENPSVAIAIQKSRAALWTGQMGKAEEILKALLHRMHAQSEDYNPLDVATVQYELADVLEGEGKCEEARLERETMPDF